MKTVGVIPARYASTRFPAKPLARILGKPMIVWVAEKVAEALGVENTIVATDDERIASAVEVHGFRAMMTSSTALTGTDRVAEVARKINADIYMNIQGDEPLLNPSDISAVRDEKIRYPQYVINAMMPLLSTENPNDRTIPKVVFASNNSLLYMSRLPIPGTKSEVSMASTNYWKQVCIYAFSKSELEAYSNKNQKAMCEQFEDIEILRFLDMGIKVKMVKVSHQSIAVDLPEHIELVEAYIKQKKSNQNT